MVRHFSGILSHRETRAGGGGTLTRAAGSATPTEAAAHLFDLFFRTRLQSMMVNNYLRTFESIIYDTYHIIILSYENNTFV